MKNTILMKRCFDLAKQGVGKAAPNPLVGAVVLHDNKIIGEGFHAKYGQAHAEVNALKSIVSSDRKLIPKSRIIVSLEPCCIVGNTPACTDLIKDNNIKDVTFSVVDPTANVDGSSVKILEDAGCQVRKGILPDKGLFLLRPRTVWVKKKRPYVILKFAQSKDGFIGRPDKQIWLSNAYTKIASHKWRSEVNAILVGTNTAAIDNPALTNRLYPGSSPLRIVIDKDLRLPKDLKLFDKTTPTWVFTHQDPPPSTINLTYHKVPVSNNIIPAILNTLYEHNQGVLLVEGGAQLLNHFIAADCWDEARVFHTNKLLRNGIPAPKIPVTPHQQIRLKDNLLVQYINEV